MRAALAFLLLSCVVAAQDKGPQGPRQLFQSFLAETRKAAEGDEEALLRAGRLFDLSDVNPADRDDIGERAAADLANYLNRLEKPVRPSRLPSAWKEDSWTYTTEFGEIVLTKLEGGSWRFSSKTRQAISGLLEKVSDREVKRGTVEISTTETWLRDHVPPWLRNRVLLLAHWQWIGLLALLLVGLLASFLGSILFLKAAQRSARLRGVELKRGRRVGRPFGLVTMAALWWFGLRFLLLPESAYIILILAARFLLMVGVVWSISRVVDWVTEVFAGMARRTASRFDDLLVPMIRKALKVFVVALGVVWIASNLGQDVGALLAGLGIGGVALALAAKDTVANFFGALTILTDRPFEVGDWIILGDIEGTVDEVGFRSTRVRTFYNSLITFPNAMLITTAVDNLGRRKYRRFKTTIGVTYDTPADKLETFIEGIRELVRRHPYTRKDYYHVYFHGFSDNALEILIYLFFSAPNWATELRERQRLLMDILRLANRLEVGFAFPTRMIHMIEDQMPEHGEPAKDLRTAWQKGQAAATEIVEEFTGSRVPPPVRIGQRPDEALEEGE